MKRFVAVVPVLVLLAGSPALAAAAHGEQQMCLTWLSLAAQWGPEAQRADLTKQFQTLNEAVRARTDLDAAAPKETADAIAVWNKWTMDHGTGTPDVMKTMEAELLPKATACLAMVPTGEEEDVIPVPAGDGGVDGAATAG